MINRKQEGTGLFAAAILSRVAEELEGGLGEEPGPEGEEEEDGAEEGGDDSFGEAEGESEAAADGGWGRRWRWRSGGEMIGEGVGGDGFAFGGVVRGGEGDDDYAVELGLLLLLLLRLHC